MWVIEDLLMQMYERGASDLLLTAGTPPQLRINGLLQPVGTEPVDARATRDMAHSLLSDSEIAELDEKRALDFSRGFKGIARFRLNIYFQRDALALAIRIIPFAIPSFEELGIPDIAKDFACHPHGLVLVTGPAGSGKSTTLAAMIDYINHVKNVHVVCIEDPIEYVHTHHRSVIDQREINGDARSFAEALKHVFRQSPDVIMVGEMRDLETIQLAVTLAETGHLILGTLHTQDTTNAISRMVDVFPTGHQQQIYSQLSMVLVGVISQQLLLTHDGRARVLAAEVMNVNNAIRNLIREGEVQQIYSVLQTSRNEGMITMNDAIKKLYDKGIVDRDTALRASPRRKDLLRTLGIKAQHMGECA